MREIKWKTKKNKTKLNFITKYQNGRLKITYWKRKQKGMYDCDRLQVLWHVGKEEVCNLWMTAGEALDMAGYLVEAAHEALDDGCKLHSDI